MSVASLWDASRWAFLPLTGAPGPKPWSSEAGRSLPWWWVGTQTQPSKRVCPVSLEEPLQPSEMRVMLSSFYRRGSEAQRRQAPCRNCESREVTLEPGLAGVQLSRNGAGPVKGGSEHLCWLWPAGPPTSSSPASVHGTEAGPTTRGGSIIAAESRPTLCSPVNCSTPGFPVLHYLTQFTQTHVY